MCHPISIWRSETHRAFRLCHCLTPAEGSVSICEWRRYGKIIAPPKLLSLRELQLVFVVCFIVFISIILNVAHHSLSSEYTKMRCKDTNFLSYKHQNAREIIHIYNSLTLKYALFRFFGCKINRYQWYLPNLATIQPNSTLNDINPPKSSLFIEP